MLKFFHNAAERSSQANLGFRSEVSLEVANIIEGILKNGESEVENISKLRDGEAPREIPKSEWKAYSGGCSENLLKALLQAAANIEEYQNNLLIKDKMFKNSEDGNLGVLTRPVERAGIYIPGGTSAYPSTVLMTAIPARIAGVSEIIACTPPGDKLKPEVFAAALIANVDRLFSLGGVPAIASMAFGVGSVPRCDVIAGPGNAYVTEAKRQVLGFCGIDSTAGPSDILVVCDDTANPKWVAADLLSQAEHGALSEAILVSLSESVAKAVLSELESQVKALPRRAEAEESLKNNGAYFLPKTKDEALAIINEIAPEHLEIITENPNEWLSGIRNAGAVFLGAYSPEPLGDYWAGPSHVLPTGGSSRFFSPVSVETFTKRISVIEYGKTSFQNAAKSIAQFARAEGLEAHALSAEVRL